MKTIHIPPLRVNDACEWLHLIETTHDKRFNVESPLSTMRRRSFKVVGEEVIESAMSGMPPDTRPNLP